MAASRGKYQVIVDAWENQRFKPLQGWTKPYGDLTPQFSDIHGVRVVDYATINGAPIPVAALPEGWEYTDDWNIDRSEKYGGIDTHGWSYATSFETLFDNTLRCKSEGEMGRMSLVRRRRWTRVRACHTPAAATLFEKKVQYVNALRYQLEKILQQKEKDFKDLTLFHENKLQQLHPVVKYAARGLSDTVTVLDHVVKKLLMVRDYLVERGTVEAQHAARLIELGRKWQFCGSVPNELQAVVQPPTDCPVPPRQPGFFFTVGDSDRRQAERMLSYSTMLTDFLPHDVDSVLERLRSIVADCQHEGGELAIEVATCESQLDAAYLSCKNALVVSRKDAFDRTTALTQILSEVSAARNMNDVEDLTKVHFNAVYDEDFAKALAENAAKGASESTMFSSFTGAMGGGSYSPRLESSQNKSVDVSHVDIFLAVKNYHRCAIKTDSSITMYSAFTKQQRKEARSSTAKVQALLHATLKIFGHEQCRMWEELLHDLNQNLQSQQSQQRQLTGGTVNSALNTGSGWKEALPTSTAAAIVASQIEEEEYSALCNPAFPSAPLSHVYAYQGRLCVAVSIIETPPVSPRSSNTLEQASPVAGVGGGMRGGGRKSLGSGITNPQEANLAQYYLNLQKYIIIPDIHGKAVEYRWLPVTAVVTYDGNLLLYESYPGDKDRDTDADQKDSAGRTRTQKWFHSDALLRTHLRSADVEPLITLGLDAFIIKNININDRNSKNSGSVGFGGITTKAIALLSSSSDDARKWMAAMVHPIADTDTEIEAPLLYSDA